jgi:hypothetical protein
LAGLLEDVANHWKVALALAVSDIEPIASSNYKSIELPPELVVGPEYGLTVSRKAAPAAADFAMYLLSPPEQASLKAFGFIPGALPAKWK